MKELYRLTMTRDGETRVEHYGSREHAVAALSGVRNLDAASIRQVEPDISDDLQELRERIEVMAVSREDAEIITRAALEIARLRGEAPITKEEGNQ